MIEMLATILILLAILIIATPSIRRMLNKTNELSQEYIENIIIDAAKEYAIVNNKAITSNLKVVGDTSVITLPTLMNMGLIEQEDIDKLGEDARVLLTLTEDNSIVYSIVYDSSLAQSNAIQLVLIGNNPLHVKQGTPYLEPGYIAYDKNGKIVTDKVVVSGTVNTTTIGNYQLTYRLTDDLGNTEEEIRTVVVIDSTRPVVNTAVVTSNNIHNNKYAKNGEIVTLNITFSKVVTDPKVTIGKREAVVTGSGNTRVATLTIPSDESTLVNKALEINISEYKDIHENIGEEKADVTSGGLVVFDNIKPIIVSSTIISNNTNNKLVKNNETITMTSVFSEPIINPIIRIGGRVTTISGTTTNTITSNYLIPSGESTLTQGNIEGTITSYMDRAGNFGESNDIKLVGATVLYDRTAPTCASSGGSAVWRNTDLTITGTCSDTGGSGCAGNVTKVLSATTAGTSPGTVSDNAGNTTVCSNQVANIDKVAPSCASSGGSTAWRNTDLTITGTCSDTGGSGCAGNVSKLISATTAGAAGNNSGGTVSDNAGNTASCSANQTVRIDKTPPVVAEAYSGGMIFTDPNFSSGTNSFGIYNNTGNGNVKHTRIALSNPYGSYVMRITTSGVASPGHGGYVQSVTSRANAIYIHKIIAKIPVGYTIQRASNAVGTGSNVYWITSQAGTGSWQEYVYIQKAGSSGTFSTFGHVYLTGGAAPVTWDVAYSTIIDVLQHDKTASIAFRTTDSGSGYTHYGINTSSTIQPEYTAVTNSSDLGLESAGYTSNEDYYIWVKDAAGNVSRKTVTVNTANCFTYTKTSTEVTITRYNGKCVKELLIPDKIENLPVTSIGNSAFTWNQLTSVTIPSSVTSIGNYAFADNQLTSVVIPSSVTIIAFAAFQDNQLTSVVIPSSVTMIGEYAFRDNQLTSIIIPSSVKTIGQQTFFGNQLTSVVIPSSVTSIGNSAFAYNQLTSVTLPSSLKSIGYEAFSNNQLTSVTIPSSVTYIDYGAFNNNQLPDNQAFLYARKSDGSEDKTILLGYVGTKRNNVVIPSSVTSIRDDAFRDNQLTSVVIPSSVTSIGNGAFSNNQLTSVTLPSNLNISNWSISYSFYTSYVTDNNKVGGTYTSTKQNGVWTKQ